MIITVTNHMKMRLQLFGMALLFSSAILSYAYDPHPSRAKAAYLSSNIPELVTIAVGSDVLEANDATEFIAMSDLSLLDYGTLRKMSISISKSQNEALKSFITDHLKERELDVLKSFNGMTSESFGTFIIQNPQYADLAKEYVSTLSCGLDSLNYQELRYLRLKCPLFDKAAINQFSKSRSSEVMPDLEKQMQNYKDIENRAMEWFTAALSYELMEGLMKQFKQFSIAYSMDENMEESLPSYIYNAYMDLLKQYWNDGIVYEYVLAQTKNYNESIDSARSELLKNLGINGKKQNVIQIPSVNTGITLGMGGFQKIGNIRSDLNASDFGSSVVAGLASFLVGGFISSVGQSAYMSGERKEAARLELPHRRSYLLATYDKLQNQLEKEIKKMTAEMKSQQSKQSQDFYDYVLKNY